MWFNSTISEEPYQGLTSSESRRNVGVPLWNAKTGAAWLSSARVVRCTVKSENERNPYSMLNIHRKLPRITRRKVGMTSNQHGPYTLGDTRATMGKTMGRQVVRRSKPHQICPQFGLRAATRPHEAGIASKRVSAMAR